MFEFMGVPLKCSFLQSYFVIFCRIYILSFKNVVFKFYRNLASCNNILGNNNKGNRVVCNVLRELHFMGTPKRCGDTYVQLLGVGTMGTFFSQENYGISKPFFTVTNWDIFCQFPLSPNLKNWNNYLKTTTVVFLWMISYEKKWLLRYFVKEHLSR